MNDLPANNFWMSGNTLTLETLPDMYVLEFIVTNQTARADFDEAFLHCSDERQAYLTNLIEENPFVKTKVYVDPKTKIDAHQRRENTAGIRVPMTPRLRKLKAKREAEKNQK